MNSHKSSVPPLSMLCQKYITISYHLVSKTRIAQLIGNVNDQWKASAKKSGGKKERLPFYHFRRLCQYHGFLQGSYQILHRVEAGGLILQEQGGIDSALSKDFLGHGGVGEGDNFVVAGKDYFMFPHNGAPCLLYTSRCV